MVINNNAQLSSSNTLPEKMIVVAICIYVITWYLQLGSRVSLLGAIRFEFILGLLLTVASLMKLLTNLHEPSSPLKKIIIIYFLVIAFYTFFSYDRSTSIDIFFNRVVKFSMMALFFAAFVKTEWALKMVIGAFLLAMAKLGQEGVYGWLTGGLMWQNQGIMRLHGSTLMYRHPNSLSGMAVGLLPFIFYLFPISGKWQKVFLACLFVSSIIIIIFTGSRTGYVATVLIAAYMGWDTLKNNKIKFFIVGLCAIAIVPMVTPEQYKERFVSIFTMEEAEGASSETRLQILEDAMSVSLAKPWGVGVAAFPYVREEMFGRTQDTHNLYLELLTNLSFVGTFIFLFFIYKMILINQDTAKKCREEGMYFVEAISRSVVAFLMARLFLGLFGMDTYEIYWWFAAGLTISCFYICKNRCAQVIKSKEVLV